MNAVAAAKSHILFVDDEQRVLNSMRVMFRRDYQLHLTTSGPEALAIIAREPIDVIVADMRMPEMTGVEVLSAVKTRSPKTVRILLTGYADLDAIEGSINEGEVFRFLTKPCAPEELRETIREAASIARDDVLAVAVLQAGLGDAGLAATAHELVAEAVSYSEPAADELVAMDELELEDEPLSAPQARQKPATPAAEIPTLSKRVEPVRAAPPPKAPEPRPLAAKPPAAKAPVVKAPAVKAAAEPLRQEPRVEEHQSDDDEEAQTIILEGDSVKIVQRSLASDPETPAAGPRREEVGVVVFTGDRALLGIVRESLANRHHVAHASNIVNVVKLLESHRPGVLITDVSEDAKVIERMTANLKEHLPELVTIVVGEHRDTVELVSLINHGQIFRFLRKPLTAEICLRSVQAATAKHLLFRRYPDLLKRHSVRAIAEEERGRFAETFGSFITRLRNMRKMWHSSETTH